MTDYFQYLFSAMIIPLFALLNMAATPASTSIEGQWKFVERGVIILIYEEEGRYFGQLIETGNAEDNEKLKQHNKVVILKNFKQKSPSEYCCGTIFAPKHNKTLSATILLEDANTLRVNAKYGILTGSEILIRL